MGTRDVLTDLYNRYLEAEDREEQKYIKDYIDNIEAYEIHKYKQRRIDELVRAFKKANENYSDSHVDFQEGQRET